MSKTFVALIAVMLAVTAINVSAAPPAKVVIMGSDGTTIDIGAILALPTTENEAPIPEIKLVESIPLEYASNPKLRDTFQLTYKGQIWEGGTTVYAGAEIANVYSLLQAPGAYTAGEWATVGLGLAGTYFLAEDQGWLGLGDDGGSGGSAPPAPNTSSAGNSGNSGAGGNSLGFGNIQNSTIFIQQGSNDPQGEGNNSQGESNSDGTASSGAGGSGDAP
jgi:hypothetical protein